MVLIWRKSAKINETAILNRLYWIKNGIADNLLNAHSKMLITILCLPCNPLFAQYIISVAYWQKLEPVCLRLHRLNCKESHKSSVIKQWTWDIMTSLFSLLLIIYAFMILSVDNTVLLFSLVTKKKLFLSFSKVLVYDIVGVAVIIWLWKST